MDKKLEEILKEFDEKFGGISPIHAKYSIKQFLAEKCKEYALSLLPDKMDGELEKFIDGHHFSYSMGFNACLKEIKDKLK